MVLAPPRLGYCSLGALAARDGGAGFLVHFALPLGFAFVPVLLTLGKRKFAFHLASSKIKTSWDESKPLLVRLNFKLAQLLFMKKETARTRSVVIHQVAVRERSNVRVQKKSLAVFKETVGILEVGLAFADGFDLSSLESHAAFELVEEKIIMTGRTIDS